MKRNPVILIHVLLALLAAPLSAYDIPGFTPDAVIPFKQTVNSTGGAVTLNLHVFTPPGHRPSDSRPAIVFFFGGGWVDGSASHFHPHCEYLASRGIVAISAEYRVNDLHGTTPRECVKDGKSAIRYVRENAAALGVDPNRIAAGGGSAGGHVAAAAGTLSAYEETGENLAVSSKPNALVLYNPVVDNGPGGYGHNIVQSYWETISPLHNIAASAPPTVFFLGTNDSLIPVSVGKNYQAAMESLGLRCDLHLYEGQPHSFFNYDVPDDGSGPFYGYRDTLFKTDGFLVSLGWLEERSEVPAPVAGWVTIFGDSGFADGSESSSSPVTTDADVDAIAANFPAFTLADGDFIRLTGTVSLNAPLTAGNFRIGLFDGDDPVTPGDGTGYVGIWASAPSTAATTIASGNGTGTSNPFEVAASATLGPIPAATTTVPANTPVAFTLMISRNGGNLDITARFTDGGSYDQAQNLLNQPVAHFTYDSAAFLMTSNLNATRAEFSAIEITTGKTLAEIAETVSGAITYVDVTHGATGNTYATGGSPENTAWLDPVPGSIAANNTQWALRENLGTNGTIYQSIHSGNQMPELTTAITGLAVGDYDIWAFFWDGPNTNTWTISAGLESGALTTYSVDGPGNRTAPVAAFTLAFAGAPPLLTEDVRILHGVKIGRATVGQGGTVPVFVNNLSGGGSNTRTWFDGVGYAPAADVQPPPLTPGALVLGIDFNRSDALGAPGQSLFRAVSGSATQAANAPTYLKNFGSRQVSVSQPDGEKLEFRGGNGDGTRAIPGGETSLSFLVSDFIATRKGAIDISITNLAAGVYVFRSWHLDTFTGATHGFAQGAASSSPNSIEARLGGALMGSVQATSLGSVGLNTTYIGDAQIPQISFGFSHDGTSPLIINLRSTIPNGAENFLLLNGFAIHAANP